MSSLDTLSLNDLEYLLVMVSGGTARATWITAAAATLNPTAASQPPAFADIDENPKAALLDDDARIRATTLDGTLSAEIRTSIHLSALDAVEIYESDPGWACRCAAWHLFALGRSDEGMRRVTQAAQFAVAAGDLDRALDDFDIAIAWTQTAAQQLGLRARQAGLATQEALNSDDSTYGQWAQKTWLDILSDARGHGQAEIQAQALLNLYWLSGSAGPLEEAASMATPDAPVGWAWRARGFAKMLDGRYREAIADYQVAIRVARQHDDTVLEALAHEGIGMAYYWSDEELQALRHARAAAEQYRQASDPQGDLVASTLCIELEAVVGRLSDARATALQLLERMVKLGAARWLAEIQLQQAWIEALAGNVEAAWMQAQSITLPETLTPRSAPNLTLFIEVAILTDHFAEAAPLLAILERELVRSPQLEPFAEIACWARFMIDAPAKTRPADLRKLLTDALKDASPTLTARLVLAGARIGRRRADSRLLKIVAHAAGPLIGPGTDFVSCASSEADALAESDPAKRRVRLAQAMSSWTRSGRMRDALECQMASAVASIEMKDRPGAEQRFRDSLATARSLGAEDVAVAAQTQLRQLGLHPSMISAAQHPIFSVMDPVRATELELLGTTRTFSSGELITDAQAEAWLVLIQTGSVALLTGGERSRICEIRGPSDTVGARNLVALSPPRDVMARQETNVWMVSAAQVQQYIAAHPDIAQTLATAVISEDADRATIAAQSALWSVRERLAHVLIDLETRFSHPQRDGSTVVRLSLTTIEIAQLASTSRKSVSPLLGELRDAGIVDHSRKSIVFYDLHALKAWLPEDHNRADLAA